MLELPEELLYLRPIQLLRHIPPLPGGKRQFVDLCHERRELALESDGRNKTFESSYLPLEKISLR